MADGSGKTARKRAKKGLGKPTNVGDPMPHGKTGEVKEKREPKRK